MESQAKLLFLSLLPGVRLQKVRDQILDQFTLVTVCRFERTAVRDHHLEYLHVQWKPAQGALLPSKSEAKPPGEDFVARCDFHWVRQLQPVADFLENYNTEAMLCCQVGEYDMAQFASARVKHDAVSVDSILPVPNLWRGSATALGEVSPPEEKEGVPDDALIKSCLHLSSPFTVTETREYGHEQLSLLACVRPHTKCVPLHYRIRKDELGRAYYASWAARADPAGVRLSREEADRILKQYDAMVNTYYKHNPETRVRARWGRPDSVEVFWEAAARVLRPSDRLVIAQSK